MEFALVKSKPLGTVTPNVGGTHVRRHPQGDHLIHHIHRKALLVVDTLLGGSDVTQPGLTERINTNVEAMSYHGDDFSRDGGSSSLLGVAETSSGAYGEEGDSVLLKKWAVHVRDHIQPQGDVGNDDSLDQRVLNVVTSLPFLGLGAYMMSRHKSPEGRAYGKSMLLVGASATGYHATWGALRRLCRKMDYYSISFASAKMVRAIWPESKALKRAVGCSWLCVPFKPFLISTGYALAMQREFFKLGMKDESLRPHLIGHAITAGAGALAFTFEESLGDIGFKHTHSLWHCLSAYGVYTTSKLIEYKEHMRVRRVHDSALSLVDLVDKTSMPRS